MYVIVTVHFKNAKNSANAYISSVVGSSERGISFVKANGVLIGVIPT